MNEERIGKYLRQVFDHDLLPLCIKCRYTSFSNYSPVKKGNIQKHWSIVLSCEIHLVMLSLSRTKYVHQFFIMHYFTIKHNLMMPSHNPVTYDYLKFADMRTCWYTDWRTEGWADGRTNARKGQIVRQRDRWTDERTNGQIGE